MSGATEFPFIRFSQASSFSFYSFLRLVSYLHVSHVSRRLFLESNPIPTKKALQLMGKIGIVTWTEIEIVIIYCCCCYLHYEATIILYWLKNISLILISLCWLLFFEFVFLAFSSCRHNMSVAATKPKWYCVRKTWGHNFAVFASLIIFSSVSFLKCTNILLHHCPS